MKIFWCGLAVVLASSAVGMQAQMQVASTDVTEIPLTGVKVTQLAMLQGDFPPAVKPRKWEMGPFVDYGNGLLDRTDYHFFMAGFQVGRVMTPMVHAGALSGRFELGGNVMPLFQAYTPAAHSVTTIEPGGDSSTTENYGGGNVYGGECDAGGLPVELWAGA